MREEDAALPSLRCGKETLPLRVGCLFDVGGTEARGWFSSVSLTSSTEDDA